MTSINEEGTKPNRRYRLCLVCGDKSTGFNFGAITCESCKAFFRRNAKKTLLQIGKCEFNETCVITVKTRKFCSVCRLKKCFAVGMNESAILGETEKKARQEKVAFNRVRKMQRQKHALMVLPNSKKSLEVCPMVIESSGSSSTTNNELQKEDDSSVSNDGGRKSAERDSHSTISTPIDSLQRPFSVDTLPLGFCHDANPVHRQQHNGDIPVNAISASSQLSSPLSTSSSLDPKQQQKPQVIIITPGVTPAAAGCDSTELISVGMPPSDADLSGKLVSLNPLLTRNNLARLLTQEQWNTLRGVSLAYETCFSYDLPPEGSYTLSNLVNTSSFIVRKLITFAKRLSDFVMLHKSCQVTLLKGVVLNTLFLRSANSYDVERDVWITPNGYIPTSILAEATGLQKLYEEHSKYCKTFRKVVNNNHIIIALMQVLCLFSPERDRLVERQRIASIYDRYVILLKHYLEAEFGYLKARHTFSRILSNMDELQELSERHGSVLWRVDPNSIDPLMLEVFSLNEVSFLSRNYHQSTGESTCKAADVAMLNGKPLVSSMPSVSVDAATLPSTLPPTLPSTLLPTASMYQHEALPPLSTVSSVSAASASVYSSSVVSQVKSESLSLSEATSMDKLPCGSIEMNGALSIQCVL